MSTLYALAAALLFSVSVPAGKLLLAHLRPLQLSALCYAGSALGLLLWRAFAWRGAEGRLERRDMPYVAGFTLAGGVLAPLLLFNGLSRASSASASMMLNFELVFTSLIAVLAFGERGGWRLWTAAALVTGGGLALSGGAAGAGEGALLVLGAALMWGLDNNLTARVSLKDPVPLAALKGLAGGLINGVLALYAGGPFPQARWAAAALALGALSYGASLAFLILAMRELGASRAGAFFGVYPFLGAALGALLLGEPASWRLALAGGLMLAAFLLLASERHAHFHCHEALEHDHLHAHGDGHHGHPHSPIPPGAHSHRHRHELLEHLHPHSSDAHHLHGH